MSLIAKNVRSIVDHDGAVILDIEHDAMVTLNSTGAYVWGKLQQGRPIDEIIGDLAAESDVDLMSVERDVRAFLEELKSNHLIVS